MATKPTVLPMWAESDQADPISGSNNVLTPPPALQTYGWIYKQFPPRNFFNWLGRYTYRWLAWLKQQEEQAIITDGTGATASFNAVVGGLAFIYVVDIGNAANVYHGMAYLPPAGVGAAFKDIKKVGFNTPSISAGGNVTMTGGTGPYICYAQTKIIA
jgi:hypothetical protein